jgi:hypothetical protein
MPDTVIVLGAGATKSVGGPLTQEILYEMLQSKADADTQGKLLPLEQFLIENFHLQSTAQPADYPGLPLLMSLLDLTIDRRQPFRKDWTVDRVSEIRAAVEMGIFYLLERKLVQVQTSNHYNMLQKLYPVPADPCIISLNYDLTIDTALMFLSEQRFPDGCLPNYHCDIRTDFYRNDQRRFGSLLKLHGSLNFLYCKTCHRLEIGASESKKYLKILGRLMGADAKATLDTSYMQQGSPCLTCSSELRPLLIAPTQLKNYRNPHLSQIWYEAERMLRECKRAIFIGYSMPDDDLEVVYLFKRGLAHLKPSDLTVVEYDTANPALQTHDVGRRYRALFGDVDWHPEGLDVWLSSPQQAVAVPG